MPSPWPYLPSETLDYVVDALHDESPALKECCLVSKLWIPRSRRHLFAHVRFYSADNLKSWKKTFPDPAKSPAYHTHTLFIGCVRFVEEADAEEGGWIQAFSRVEQLVANCPWTDLDPTEISLVPFHKFAPTLKSLRVYSLLFPLSQVFNLICSLPLLEDLDLIGRDGWAADDDNLSTPSTAVPLTPAFTGTLQLHLEMTSTARRLLDLPNGLHFRKLNLSWRNEDELQWAARLVGACSGTLECLDLTHDPDDEPSPSPINLSKVSKLKSIVFRCGYSSSEWVATTLETITPQHRDLQQIAIHPDIWDDDGDDIFESIVDTDPGAQWLDVDRLLVQFWDSRSIRSKFMYLPMAGNEKVEIRDRAGRLLPELTKRGIIDLVECSSEIWQPL